MCLLYGVLCLSCLALPRCAQEILVSRIPCITLPALYCHGVLFCYQGNYVLHNTSAVCFPPSTGLFQAVCRTSTFGGLLTWCRHVPST